MENGEAHDARWPQPFANYRRGLARLAKFVRKGELNELEVQGLIFAFEYTFDLACNLLKDFLLRQGNKSVVSSRDAIREGFCAGVIDDGEGWMEMFQDRQKTATAFDDETATEIAGKVVTIHFKLFYALQQKVESLMTLLFPPGDSTLRWGLKEATIDSIVIVFTHFPQVKQVLLYGSRVAGTHRSGSDIDLSVVGELTPSEQFRLGKELDDLFLPYKIDLSHFHQISNESLLEHIKRVGVAFYEKEG